MRWLTLCLLLPAATAAIAETAATVKVCYDYGCLVEEEVHYAADQLVQVRDLLGAPGNADEERGRLSQAVGWLLGWAGQQTPIAADRGGNVADGGVHGRMDCIDHSTTTTRLLQLLEARGALRFHRVVEPARRTRLILQHFSAVIEVLSAAARVARLPPGQALAGCNCTEDGQVIGDADGVEHVGERYVVDSWFVDNGEPAVVLPLAEWLNGGGPNVE